jgi:pSer/pThr/pTyr-binding forkhead associated (FHA) protein
MRMPSRPPPQRPLAPDLNFLPKIEAPPPEERVVCTLCGSRNQRSVRFCVACGHLLAQAPGARESIAAKAPVPSAPAPPIAPMPVVELSNPAPAGARTYICPKCHGLCEGPGPFCRFCGHSLTEAVASPGLAQNAPPAMVLAPAVVLAPAAAPLAAHAPLAAPALAVAAPVPAVAVARSAVVGGTIPIPGPSTVRYRLVLVARDGSEGASFVLGESADVGRSEGDIVIADDRYVSPRHARVTLRGGAYFLRDLGSINGVFVRIPFVGRLGEETVPEQPLADQELFLVGQQVLRFEVVKHADEGFGVASENGTLLFGTPAAPRYARITQRTVEGVVRDVFHVRKAEMVIGRESGDIVFTDDPFLSRRHAVLRVHGIDAASPSGPTFGLADLGSSNGTFLKIRDEVRLQRGTHFRIGQQLLRFDADPAGAGA